MRLVPTIDGVVDRLDRAVWLTLPFDLAFEQSIRNELLCVVELAPSLVVSANQEPALVGRVELEPSLSLAITLGDQP